MKVLTKTKSDTNQARRQSSVTGGHTQFFLGGHKNFFHSNVKEKIKKQRFLMQNMCEIPPILG